MDEEHGLDRPAPFRPSRRVGPPGFVAPEDRGDLLAHLHRLLFGEEDGALRGAGCVRPLRVEMLHLLPAPVTGEPPLEEHVGELARGDGLLFVADAREAEPPVHELPRPPAAGAAARLLDEAVLRELAEVERAGGRRLADALARLGRRHGTLEREELEQGEAYRMRERPHLLGGGELADPVATGAALTWRGILSRGSVHPFFSCRVRQGGRRRRRRRAHLGKWTWRG